MIRVFNATDTDFSSNGEKVIQPIKAVVHCEDNGEYYLTLDASTDYEQWLVGNNIIVAPAPQIHYSMTLPSSAPATYITKEYQPFRIREIIRDGKKISVKAPHVSFDSDNYISEFIYSLNETCDDAIRDLLSYQYPSSATSRFYVTSDVTGAKKIKYPIGSFAENIEHTVDRFGGHVVRDIDSGYWLISISKTIGHDSGITIRYGSNLKEITCTEDWSDVCTLLMPTGKDGMWLNDYTTAKTVQPSAGTHYDIPFYKIVAFEQNIEREDYPDGAQGDLDYQAALGGDLMMKATNYIDKACKPALTYTLKANIEKPVGIGDTIHVIDDRLGLNPENNNEVLTKVVAYDYDCLLGKYNEVEFSNFKKKKLKSLINYTADYTIERINRRLGSLHGGMPT